MPLCAWLRAATRPATACAPLPSIAAGPATAGRTIPPTPTRASTAFPEVFPSPAKREFRGFARFVPAPIEIGRFDRMTDFAPGKVAGGGRKAGPRGEAHTMSELRIRGSDMGMAPSPAAFFGFARRSRLLGAGRVEPHHRYVSLRHFLPFLGRQRLKLGDEFAGPRQPLVQVLLDLLHDLLERQRRGRAVPLAFDKRPCRRLCRRQDGAVHAVGFGRRKNKSSDRINCTSLPCRRAYVSSDWWARQFQTPPD